MLSGFIGEFIILSNTFGAVNRTAAVLAALAVILGAAYMLSLVQRIFYGPESELANSKPANDLRIGELAVLAPLVVLMLVMGLAPSLWLNSIQSGVYPPPPAGLRDLQGEIHSQGPAGLTLCCGLSAPTEIPTSIQKASQRPEGEAQR
jgi:NADH-quinone oxidoreductase subunit M